MDETVPAPLDAAVSSVRISWRPISGAFNFSGLYRAIADGGARQKPVTESKRVNERFESRTNLSVCGGERAIEFTLRVIATPDERANAAAGIVNRHDRTLEIWHGGIIAGFRCLIICLQRMMEIGLVLDFCELSLEGLLRGILHGRIQGCVNKKTAVMY